MHSDGSIYFSDPWYGRMPVYGVERPRVLGFQGVYRVPPGGGAPQLVVERDVFDQPNGLCFSPDEKKLYINDTVQANIRVFDVKPDGTLANRMLFAGGIKSDREPGVPDGMKCNSRGNVWVTGPGGVWVYAPGGELIGKVRIPERAANLAWGGPDFQTCSSAPPIRFMREDESDAAHGAIHARGRRRCDRVVRAATATLFAAATSAASVNAGSNPHGSASRSVALRAHHPGHAERCGDGGRRVRGVGLARALPPTKRDREYPPAGRCLPRARRAGDPCLVSGRTWCARRDHERASLRGASRNQRHGARQLGLGASRGLERKAGDHVVEKDRMSAWEGTRLETILKSLHRDVVIVTGAWTNMSIEHTARTGADKGYMMVVPEDSCSTMNAEWHNASINYALQNVSAVTKTDEVIGALA